MKFHEDDKFLLHNHVYLCLQCESVLLPWIPFKSESVFSLNNKKPGIFEGLIY